MAKLPCLSLFLLVAVASLMTAESRSLLTIVKAETEYPKCLFMTGGSSYEDFCKPPNTCCGSGSSALCRAPCDDGFKCCGFDDFESQCCGGTCCKIGNCCMDVLNGGDMCCTEGNDCCLK